MLLNLEDLAPAQGVLFDLDGTLIFGGKAFGRAAELLDELADRFVIVTNNAEHTPEEMSETLKELGLTVPPQQILLAGALAVEVIAKEHPGGRIMLLGGRALEKMAEDLGLIIEHDSPDVVLLARDRAHSFERLGRAATAVKRGAKLFVANPDLIYPTPDGTIIPETGALLAALLACTGPVDYRLVGKPETELLKAGLARLGCSVSQAVMIGDNPATDGEVAKRLGIDRKSVV